jgi:alanyl-tRNA synthetase
MPQFLPTDEIRKRWIAFFVSKEHKHIASGGLIPQNDPSVLFTGAGMNQFKDNFLGRAKIDHPRQRAVTVQKCVRAGDIDNVGRTASHHTFFEMLGNFSFGDYFKKEAIQWAAEFLVDPKAGLGLETERLSVTVYAGDPKLNLKPDEEAIAYWKQYAPWLKDPKATEGVEPGWRIYAYGEHDNFWPAAAPSNGPNGPCGPCSEIYYDMQPGDPPKPVAEDSKRYCEIWNLVFTGYDRQDVGKIAPLPKPNIDTGAGLERMARVIQGKASNFDIDLLVPIVQTVAKRAKKEYGKDFDSDRRMRRITDHIRMATFAIADGAQPKNEGRNYVVRRLMRRAILDGQELGIDTVFTGQIAAAVIEQMKVGYPELAPRRETLVRLVEEEEKSFDRTLKQGRQRFDEVVAKVKQSGTKQIAGADAFRLWDTSGFPIELTREEAEQQGLQVDEAGFRVEQEKAKERTRDGGGDPIFQGGPLAQLKEKFAGQPTVFEGYRELHVENAVVLAIIEGDKLVDRACDTKVTVLVDRTPFYGESGGQVGDQGWISIGHHRHQVLDSQKVEGLVIHEVKLTGGLCVDDSVILEVNINRRHPTRQNHSATHLLHLALRETLGTHVEQRGSLVASERFRFDFTHFEAVTEAQIQKIEARVNELVQEDYLVETHVTTPAKAREMGAMALFGEKYGDSVRLVMMGPSKELCGGTHCERTGQIGYFRVLSESSIAAGVRRIEAVTGAAAVAEAQRVTSTLTGLARTLKTKAEDVAVRIEALQTELAARERELESHRKKAANAAAGELLHQARDIKGVQVLAAGVEGADADALRTTLDGLRKEMPEGAVVLAGTRDGKVSLLVSCSPEAVKRGVKAGDLLKQLAPIVGGKGGGKPEMAQGGGTDGSKVAELLKAADELVAKAAR